MVPSNFRYTKKPRWRARIYIERCQQTDQDDEFATGSDIFLQGRGGFLYLFIPPKETSYSYPQENEANISLFGSFDQKCKIAELLVLSNFDLAFRIMQEFQLPVQIYNLAITPGTAANVLF